jgi:peptidoglycan/LPS O-acetylase OafA/YrhL
MGRLRQLWSETTVETSQIIASPAVANPLRQNLEKKTIPSLDGLRGISALSVALAHGWSVPRRIPADYAVVLFFEISGLLITWLLLTEQDRSGSVDRINFMKRRTLRLFPAFYVFWLLTWLVPGVPGRWWSFAYMMDFYNAMHSVPGNEANILGMAWSLGIEEKYYLLWPSFVTRFKRESLFKAMVVLFFLVQAYHIVIFNLGHVMWAAWGFDTRVDAIILGSAMAIAIKSGWAPPSWWSRPPAVWASVVLVMLLSGTVWVHRLSYGVLISVYPLAIILMAVIARPPRFLNNKVASYFGRISYSLYLYNGLIVYCTGRLPFLHGFLRVAANIGGSILAATLSYHLIERPFLRLKEKFHRNVLPAPSSARAGVLEV